jgi:outer membrane protein assembly factor BamB
MLKRISVILSIAAVACTARAGSEWPIFRGPGGQGVSDAKNVPTEWSATDNVAWKTEIPGSGWSSPVVSDGTIYLTSAIPIDGSENLELAAVAEDVDSGKVDWVKPVFTQDAETAADIHRKNGHASPTPIVSDGRLYVHFGHQGTACLDLDGRVRWMNRDFNYTPVHGNGGSPLLVGDCLIFSCDGQSDPFVVALDKDTGKVRWREARQTSPKKSFSFCTPTAIEIDGRTLVVLPGSDKVTAYDPKDGSTIWSLEYDGYSVVPKPVYGHGLIFMSTGFDRAIALAIDPSGHGDVTETHLRWQNRKSAPKTPSMLLVGSELYMFADNGVGTCMDALTGRVHWNERIIGGSSASPVFANGRIYMLDEAGKCAVIDAGREYKLLGKNELGEKTFASPAVIDGALIIRTETALYRIGA